MDSTAITQIVSQIGSIGFAVWYAWWTTTHTIPHMSEKHDMLVRKLVDDFRLDIRDERKVFIDQLSIMNNSSERMCEAITELRKTISDVNRMVP